MAEKLKHTHLTEMTRFGTLDAWWVLEPCTLIIQVPSETSSFTLKMEAARFSEM